MLKWTATVIRQEHVSHDELVDVWEHDHAMRETVMPVLPSFVYCIHAPIWTLPPVIVFRRRQCSVKKEDSRYPCPRRAICQACSKEEFDAKDLQEAKILLEKYIT